MGSGDVRDYQGGKPSQVAITGYKPDLAKYKTQHMLITLSTAGTVTKVDIPEWAWYIKVYSPIYVVFYAVDEDPVQGTAKTGTDLTAADLSIGDFATPGLYEVRVPVLGAREIRLVSAQTGAQIYVSFLAGQ